MALLANIHFSFANIICIIGHTSDLYYDHLAQGPLSESDRLEFEEHVAQTLNISGSNSRGEVAIALSGIIVSGPPAELIYLLLCHSKLNYFRASTLTELCDSLLVQNPDRQRLSQHSSCSQHKSAGAQRRPATQIDQGYSDHELAGIHCSCGR